VFATGTAVVAVAAALVARDEWRIRSGREGMPRMEVIELLGQPDEILSPPFASSTLETCRTAVVTETVYERMFPRASLVVYFDAEDRVSCTARPMIMSMSMTHV
jgi:hypothetical protein